MKINILTIFPDMFAPIRMSMLGRAIDNGIIELNVTDIRDYTTDRHNRVDDTPYGGGAGMVMQVQPILDAFEASGFGGDVIYMSPRGEMISGDMARELSGKDEITILCGHYEGVDQRALDRLGAREVSIGDYVLTGGELPALVLMDAIARMIPGVLHNETSAEDDSFFDGLLECPQYSRPEVWREKRVPQILLSGDHGAVARWRRRNALERTAKWRPDLLADAELSEGERQWLDSLDDRYYCEDQEVHEHELHL